MKSFTYSTSRGTRVEIKINSSDDIVVCANSRELTAIPQFTYDPIYHKPAIETTSKIDGKTVFVEINENIKEYIKSLVEEERLAKLPLKERLRGKIRLLEKDVNLLRFIDADLVTGQKYFALNKRYNKGVWNKVSKYFEYINTSHHSDDFDAMYNSNFKGWLTNDPESVKKILEKELGSKQIEDEIKRFKEELDSIREEEVQ